MTPPKPALLRRWLTLPVAALLLAGGGAALLPFSRSVSQQAHEQGLLLPPAPITGAKDALTQHLSLIMLGGLRSLAAEILALDASNAWLEQDWPRARQRWEQITSICPQRASYWARAARDMAKNAVAHVQERDDLNEHERAVLTKEYLDAAEDFLTKGVAANPGNVTLLLEMGAFYEDLARRPQFRKAVETYRRAIAAGAPEMFRRWEFYNLCRIRGCEAEALQLGRTLFRQERHRAPSLRCLLFALQNKLNIPPQERLSVETLFGSQEKAVRQLRRYLHNDLRFPVHGVAEFLQASSSPAPQSARG